MISLIQEKKNICIFFSLSQGCKKSNMHKGNIWQCKHHWFSRKKSRRHRQRSVPFLAFTHSFIDTTRLSYINNSTSTYSKHKQFFTCCSGCSQYSLLLPDFLSLQIQFFVALQDMCPLRFILIFFSTMLAAYIAWTTMTSSPEIDFTTQDRENKASSNKDHFNFIKVPSVPYSLYNSPSFLIF